MIKNNKNNKNYIKILNSYTYKAQNIILKLSSLLKTGVHLGTTLQEHYPPMPYIIGFRHNILIIDLTQTIFLLKRSLYFLVYLIRARSRACIASYTYNTFFKNYTIYNKKLNNFLSIKKQDFLFGNTLKYSINKK